MILLLPFDEIDRRQGCDRIAKSTLAGDCLLHADSIFIDLGFPGFHRLLILQSFLAKVPVFCSALAC